MSVTVDVSAGVGSGVLVDAEVGIWVTDTVELDVGVRSVVGVGFGAGATHPTARTAAARTSPTSVSVRLFIVIGSNC